MEPEPEDRNRDASGRTLRRLVFIVAGVVSLWLMIVVGVSVIQGLGEGNVRDPFTGEQVRPDVESP